MSCAGRLGCGLLVVLNVVDMVSRVVCRSLLLRLSRLTTVL
jgi:hypothetical protein